MRQGLLAGLIAIATLACTSAAIPTATPGPSATVGGQPTPSATGAPTAVPSTAPTTGQTPAPTAAPPTPSTADGWTELTAVAPGPDAREDHTWTVDADGQIAYLFGGRTTDGAAADLWAFDLATDTWTELQPAGTGPAARWGHTATWVAGVGLVVWSGQASGFFDDLWAYDPADGAWRKLPSQGAVPQARYGSCASLGPDGRLWISHGFTQDDGRFADTRAYDFATGEWTDETPTGDVPVNRCLHDCFWSDAGRLILYGGQTTGVAALGDIWSFDPAEAKWTKGPQSGAPPRQMYALAVGRSALIVGGGTLDGGFLGDAWSLDPAALTMSAQSIAGAAPAARSGATLLADPSRNRTLLFGGQNETGMLADLWELSAAPS